jgi:hypothetical protein
MAEQAIDDLGRGHRKLVEKLKQMRWIFCQQKNGLIMLPANYEW